MSIDDCCDSSCSHLDSTGCVIISHEEVNRQLDEAFKYSFREKYGIFFNSFMKNIKQIYSCFK